MAALPNSNLTLLDWAKRIDPQGNVPVIANLLSQTNEILMDAVFKMGNLPTGERCVIATGLPTVYWRGVNEGIAPSKGENAQVDEGCAMLEARSEVDIDLASLGGNQSALRMSESRLFLEAMNQEMARTMFYGNTLTNPKEFMGLATRYANLTGDGNSQNIIDGAGDTVDVETSIWLVVWGEESVYCIFPQGSSAGLVHRDLGEQTVYKHSAASGTSEPALRMQALVDWYQWKCGLVVKDWRYVVRIPNLDTSAGVMGALGAEMAPTVFTNLIHLMTRALYKVPSLSMGRPVFYVNRLAHATLSRLALEKSASAVTVQPALGQFGTARNYLSFMGVPIRLCDQIVNTEAIVT